MTVPPPGGATPPPPPPPPPSMPPMPPSGAAGQSNGVATASMVLGILSFICLGALGAIPAIFLGIAGKKKAKELGGEGEGQAKAGFILGIVNLALSVVVITIFVLLAIIGGTAAEKSSDRVDRARKEAEKSLDEFQEKTDRIGQEAKRSHFDVTEPNVEVGSFGSVTYTAFVENKADFETGFTLTVKCDGNLGETKTASAYASNLSPGDREEVSAYFSFGSDTTSASCDVSKVEYSY